MFCVIKLGLIVPIQFPTLISTLHHLICTTRGQWLSDYFLRQVALLMVLV